MKKTVNKEEFIEGFVRMGRKDNFTVKALEAMYDALIGIEEDVGIEMEYDVIAICCEYSQYKTKNEAAKDMGCSVEDLIILCEGPEFVVVMNI